MPSSADPAGRSVASRVAQLAPWFHNMVLDGVRTAPDHFLFDYPACKWASFKAVVPEDLSGRTVLDIGCNAGFYALEMKRRRASRVVAIDTDPRYLEQAALASEVTGLPLELRRMSVYEVARLGERFDLVLFMGVLYHLRHPLLALDLIRDHVAGDLLLFQSLQRGDDRGVPVEPDYPFEEAAIFTQPGMPRLQFVEQGFSGDPTNWWIPNKPAVEAMLRSSGFTIEANPEREVYLCRATEPPPRYDPQRTIVARPAD